MATNYKATLAAMQDAAVTAKRNGIVDGDDLTGNVQTATAVYALTAAEANGDTIQLTPELPEGAVVIPELCRVNAQNPGSALTVTPKLYVDGAGSTTLSTALDISAGGVFPFANASGTLDPTPVRVGAKTDVRLLVASPSGLSAGKKIAVVIAYRSKS